MFKNKDSVGGTLLVIILLSLACSIIVAGSAVLLENQHKSNKKNWISRKIF